MNPLDGIIPAVIVLGVVIGIWRGFFFELFALLAVPLSYLVTLLCHRPILRRLGNPEDSSVPIVVYVSLFVGTYIVLFLIAKALAKMTTLAHLTLLDRLAGGLFGGIKNTLIVLVILLALIAYPRAGIPVNLRDSVAVRALIRVTRVLHQHTPEPYRGQTRRYLEALQPVEESSSHDDKRGSGD